MGERIYKWNDQTRRNETQIWGVVGMTEEEVGEMEGAAAKAGKSLSQFLGPLMLMAAQTYLQQADAQETARREMVNANLGPADRAMLDALDRKIAELQKRRQQVIAQAQATPQKKEVPPAPRADKNQTRSVAATIERAFERQSDSGFNSVACRATLVGRRRTA